MWRPNIRRTRRSANDGRCERAKSDCGKDRWQKRDRRLNVSGDKDALTLRQSGYRRKTHENPPGRERSSALAEAE